MEVVICRGNALDLGIVPGFQFNVLLEFDLTIANSSLEKFHSETSFVT